MDCSNVFLVMGATGGIGSELSRRLAARGCQLALAGRDRKRLESLADQLGALAIPFDATNTEEVDSCFEKALSRFGRIDGVANCVGSLLLKPAHITTDAEWEEALATNLTPAFATVRAATRTMLRTGGSIVLVSSAAGRLGLINHDTIAAAKSGVIGLTLSAAASYANKGIRINCVAPGMVRTPLSERLTSNEATLKASTALHPLGRIGEPADVASAIEWLLDPENSWVTGQVLGVDGGLATLRPRNAA